MSEQEKVGIDFLKKADSKIKAEILTFREYLIGSSSIVEGNAKTANELKKIKNHSRSFYIIHSFFHIMHFSRLG